MKQGRPAAGIFVALILCLSLLNIAGSELLAASFGDDCDDHCDDSCDTCADCINCMPALHMLIDIDSGEGFTEREHSRTLSALSFIFEGNVGDGIFRPPQY